MKVGSVLKRCGGKKRGPLDKKKIWNTGRKRLRGRRCEGW